MLPEIVYRIHRETEHDIRPMAGPSENKKLSSVKEALLCFYDFVCLRLVLCHVRFHDVVCTSISTTSFKSSNSCQELK